MRFNPFLCSLLLLPATIQAGEKAGAPQAAATRQAKEAGGGAASEAKLERYRAAFKTIDGTNDKDQILAAMETLRQGFPASRPVLVENSDRGSARVKAFAIQVLGEQGKASADLEVVAKGLKDQHQRVRLAAVMAIRHLGEAGFKDLLEYLPHETVPNNLKMAIRTLQHWGKKEAVPHLVPLLRKTEDKGVRNFLVTALEALSGLELGQDVAAWESHVDDLEVQEQAKALAAPKQ